MAIRVYDDVMEMGRRVRSELTKDGDKGRFLEQFKLQHRAMLADVKRLISSREKWRREENERLSAWIGDRIRLVQNREDCERSRRLVCLLNADGCGFGCQLHHIVDCLMVAYGTNRTLVIDSTGWNYDKQEGWQGAFLPVSETCRTTAGATIQPWQGERESNDSLIVGLPKAIYLPFTNPPPYRPLAIPEEISEDLTRLHAYPPLWWNGQFLRYLWRPQPWLQKELEKAEQQIDFSQPIVGIHVRRTDKLKHDSKFFPIESYMDVVEEWFQTYQLQHGNDVVSRRVYLASDDPTVLPEARQKYEDYEFFGDTSVSELAQVNRRYQKSSLFGLIKDIQFLSKCHYVVCAFSSNICRATYELMQTWKDRKGDEAVRAVHSLDSIYHFNSIGHPHEQRAILAHRPAGEDEIELRVGDHVRITGNHWDGFAQGTNVRTGKSGRYPAYKAEDVVPLVKYPSYRPNT